MQSSTSRSVHRFWLSGVLAAAAVALSVTGCTPPARSPSAPSPVVPTAGPGPGSPSTAPVATLVPALDVTFQESRDGWYWYSFTALLTETGGKSAAQLKTLSLTLPRGDVFSFSGDEPLGRGCLLTPESRVVPAGGTWTTLLVYPYCLSFESRIDLKDMPVTLSVTYMDEQGTTGIAETKGRAY